MLSRTEIKIEVCANSVESCLQAQLGGADRVELCAGMPEGGTTPSYGEIKAARELLNIGLHVIIRPRGGDFMYSHLELDIMEHDIQIVRQLGVDGVVFGCLTKDGEIDIEANRRLVKAASGMSVTFHRAFDNCKNPLKALEQLIELHFNRILTSGQQESAERGISLLKSLHEQAAGRIILLAGAGVNESNIAFIHQQTDIDEYHFSAREKCKSGMVYYNPNVYMGAKGVDEYCMDVTSASRVKNTIIALLNKTPSQK